MQFDSIDWCKIIFKPGYEKNILNRVCLINTNTVETLMDYIRKHVGYEYPNTGNPIKLRVSFH